MTVDSASLTGANADSTRTARRFDWTRAVRSAGYVAVVLAIVSAATTYLILVGLTPLDPTPEVDVAAAWVNGGLIGFLILLVAWELTNLVLARLRGRAAARLHERIVLLFCAVAVVPAVLLASVASLTLGQGFDSWFSPVTQRIVNSSFAIAQAYAQNQEDQLRFDLGSVKSALEGSPDLLASDPTAFRALLSSAAAGH